MLFYSLEASGSCMGHFGSAADSPKKSTFITSVGLLVIQAWQQDEINPVFPFRSSYMAPKVLDCHRSLGEAVSYRSQTEADKHQLVLKTLDIRLQEQDMKN